MVSSITWLSATRLIVPVNGVASMAAPLFAASAKTASIMSEVNTYRDEMVVRFITGQEPLSNFGDFQARLKQMGIERAIEIQQAALARYNAR